MPITFLISFLYQISPLTSFPFGITLFFKFLFFFTYGMYFREYYLNYEKSKKELYVWLLIILAFMVIMLASPTKYFNHRYFYGVALFNVLYYYKDKILNWHRLSSFLASFGKNSLWIFLLHFDLMLLIYPWLLQRGWNYYVLFFMFFVDALIVSYFGARIVGYLYNHFENKLKKY